MPDQGPLRQAVCPRCGKRFEYASLAAHKPFPFCSDRCRDIDLGNWLTEKYAIPGPSAAAPQPPTGEDPGETEEEPAEGT